MLGAVTAALAVPDGGPRLLVVPGALAPGVAFSRASPALALGADGTTWASAAAGTPRFHGAARRLLMEGSRTNAIRNPLSEGATAGTPGTTPTNWAVSSSSGGLTRQVVGTGAESGIAYVDIRYSGTATSAGSVGIAGEGTTSVAASSGQVWACGFFTRVVAGSLTGFTASIVLRERDGAGAALAGTTVSLAPGATLPAGRQTVVRAFNQPTCAFAQAQVVLNFSSGAVVDVTLRVGLPQLEPGGSPSTPALPPPGSPAATTRAADAATVALAQPQGSIVLRAVIPQAAPAGTEQGLFQLDDGTDANRIVARNAAGGSSVEALLVSGGTTLATLAGGATTPGTPFRTVLAWDAAGFALCVTGGTVQAVATAPPAGLNRLLLGHASTALNRALFGEVERLDLHAARLPDAALLALAHS